MFPSKYFDRTHKALSKTFNSSISSSVSFDTCMLFMNLEYNTQAWAYYSSTHVQMAAAMGFQGAIRGISDSTLLFNAGPSASLWAAAQSKSKSLQDQQQAVSSNSSMQSQGGATSASASDSCGRLPHAELMQFSNHALMCLMKQDVLMNLNSHCRIHALMCLMKQHALKETLLCCFMWPKDQKSICATCLCWPLSIRPRHHDRSALPCETQSLKILLGTLEDECGCE